MRDDLVWRVSAEVAQPAAIIAARGQWHRPWRGRWRRKWRPEYVRQWQITEKLANELRERAGDEVVVSHDGCEFFAYARSRETVELVRDLLADLLRRSGRQIDLAVDHWDEQAAIWRQVDRPPGRPAAHAQRQRQQENEIDRVTMSPAARIAWVAVPIVAAVAGVIWYALSPNVGSYQVSTLLTIPLVLIVLGWLHRRLPMWLQWSVALLMVPIGPVGYLVGGGSQWWNWGQATAMPLFMLVMSRTIPNRDDAPQEPWFGGVADGPWGPP